MSLQLRPINFSDAQEFVRVHHRHIKPPVGHKFSVACYDGDRICGVAMVGRPVGRYLDDGFTLEVNRCCTDGTKNACTMLRMDTQEMNVNARKLYQKLGYTEVDTVPCSFNGIADIRLVLLEKKIK